MSTRYVVMANGRGMRWGEHLDVPKQLIHVDCQTLLERIISQVSERDPLGELIISSADSRCETRGALRHVPLRNEIELDRFPPELLTDDTCFLYGDTYYTGDAMDGIVHAEKLPLQFFATTTRIVGVRTIDPATFLRHLVILRDRFLKGEVAGCRGWDLLEQTTARGECAGLTMISGDTRDFNCPEDLDAFWRERSGSFDGR